MGESVYRLHKFVCISNWSACMCKTRGWMYRNCFQMTIILLLVQSRPPFIIGLAYLGWPILYPFPQKENSLHVYSIWLLGKHQPTNVHVLDYFVCTVHCHSHVCILPLLSQSTNVYRVLVPVTGRCQLAKRWAHHSSITHARLADLSAACSSCVLSSSFSHVMMRECSYV